MVRLLQCLGICGTLVIGCIAGVWLECLLASPLGVYESLSAASTNWNFSLSALCFARGRASERAGLNFVILHTYVLYKMIDVIKILYFQDQLAIIIKSLDLCTVELLRFYTTSINFCPERRGVWKTRFSVAP